MNKIAFLKRVVVTTGFLFLCTMPKLTCGQLGSLGAAPGRPMRSASAPPPPNLLAGLSLTNDQQVKIDQIREEAKSHLAAVANDKKLSPEAADAMFRGFQQIEDSKIFEVLTPEQKQEVRRRIATWRVAARQSKYPLQQPPVPKKTP